MKITIEGTQGEGKTTIAQHLFDWLTVEQGKSVILHDTHTTKSPNGAKKFNVEIEVVYV